MHEMQIVPIASNQLRVRNKSNHSLYGNPGLVSGMEVVCTSDLTDGQHCRSIDCYRFIYILRSCLGLVSDKLVSTLS